jgi:tRNA G10  N-methylase Trm11
MFRLENSSEAPLFIYTYACQEDELSLCHLELRTLFGETPQSRIFSSYMNVDPTRSPFIKERIQVICQGKQLRDIEEQAAHILLGDSTFKVIFIKMSDLKPADQIDFQEQRVIERNIGMHIQGEADVHQPDRVFGLIAWGGQWYLGDYSKNKPVYLQHMKKPRQYSGALTTRIARAVANIAVPHPMGIKAIDPCCGIGTVLVEALSMGIYIVGNDSNPFIVKGARENIRHFGYETQVTLSSIADITASYDTAIVDLPYNHFSPTAPDLQLFILQHARRIANRVIIISIDPLDEMLAQVGFTLIDRGFVKKSSFIRHIMVCIS